MIKYNANKHDPVERVSVEASGTVGEIADDVGNIVHAIYHHMKEEDPETAEFFKLVLQDIFADNGSAWKTREELLKED